MLFFAFGLYLANMAVGVAAQTKWFRFGWLHHALYFVVFLTTVMATVVSFRVALLLPLIALAIMPKIRPGTWKHPTVACVGLAGYGLTVVLGI